jgi:dTMP kinase
METMAMHGKYVAFEGVNGVGKSTILNGVVSELSKASLNLLVTKEPTDTSLGNFVRKEQNTLKGKSLACLAASDRINHIEQVIEPALRIGRIVISDRCVFSAYLYNKIDNVPFDYTASLYDGVRNPDAIFLFYASNKVVKERLSGRIELVRYEREDLSKENLIITECESYLNQKGVKIYRFSTEREIKLIVDDVLEALTAIINT